MMALLAKVNIDVQHVKIMKRPLDLVILTRRLITNKLRDAVATEYGQGGIADEFLPDRDTLELKHNEEAEATINLKQGT